MYLKNLHIRNIGPLDKLDIEFEIKEDSNPKPVILVGKNGSGKTYTLSYIADAFYEFAKQEFSDVVHKTMSMSYPYFRVISGSDISTKADIRSGAAYLKFQSFITQKELHYCEKVGTEAKAQELLNLYGNKINHLSKTEGNTKKILAEKDEVVSLYENVVAFFPSFRKIIPHWLNLEAQIQEIFDVEMKYGGKLNKEIMCIDTFQKNIQWMLDIILDTAVLPHQYRKFKEDEERHKFWDSKLVLSRACKLFCVSSIFYK